MYFIKLFIPAVFLKVLRPVYHGTVAWLGAIWFRAPSESMVVIGVTGTNGKTTTVNLIAKILLEARFKVGYTSTATLNVDGAEYLNTAKMTMPSGWLLQKWMAKMRDRGCQYAVVEVSSEGLSQHRHYGINFDVAVFTNLTPEHIESHGSFENYQHAKGLLFQAISNKEKIIDGHRVQKIIVTNADDSYADYFKSFKADKYVSFGIRNPADYKAVDTQVTMAGISYKVLTTSFALHLKGKFDIYNSLSAIATTTALGISLETAKSGLGKVPVVPGRVEVIQEQPFIVVVDYAYEPEEMRQLYETISSWPHRRVLQVLGPTGGGRDKDRIPLLGTMAAENAELVFVTTDDPYDDDPQALIHMMADAAVASGKIIGQTLFRNPDRRGAIAKALSLAMPGDLVLITGKGADQKMALAHGKYMDWDDRKVVREELGFKAIEDKKAKTAELS